MSGPFSKSTTVGMPTWSKTSATNGNFTQVNVSGISTADEVGYGEGGYGEDGYDVPGINLPAAGTPNWTVETTK